MSQPSETSAAVPKANCSAPSSAATTTSRPVQAAIDAHANAAAQSIAHQRLLRFGKAQLPRSSGMLDAAQGRGSSAARVSGDNHVIGIGLRNAGSYCADSRFGNQFHADARGWIDLLQVMNKLRQVLNAVNVVMWGRADQRHSYLSVAQTRNQLGHLGCRELSTFSWLRALRDLDFDFFRVDQVLGR